MDNLLLRYLRQKAGLSPEQVAAAASMDVPVYTSLETGELLISVQHSEILGKMFNMAPEVLYASSLQLEMIRTAREVNQRQNITIEMLTALVRQIRPAKNR